MNETDKNKCPIINFIKNSKLINNFIRLILKLYTIKTFFFILYTIDFTLLTCLFLSYFFNLTFNIEHFHWLTSTIIESLAALIGLIAVLHVYQLNHFNNALKQIDLDLRYTRRSNILDRIYLRNFKRITQRNKNNIGKELRYTLSYITIFIFISIILLSFSNFIFNTFIIYNNFLVFISISYIISSSFFSLILIGNYIITAIGRKED